jgi:hypothetical protein
MATHNFQWIIENMHVFIIKGFQENKYLKTQQ